VVAQTREAHDDLPRSYDRGLPELTQGPLAGLPRVYFMAWAHVARADSAFEPGLLVDFPVTHQTQQALKQGELWALPTALRAMLVKNCAAWPNTWPRKRQRVRLRDGFDALDSSADLDAAWLAEGPVGGRASVPLAGSTTGSTAGSIAGSLAGSFVTPLRGLPPNLPPLFAQMQQSGRLRVFALQATQRLHAGSATGTKRSAPAGEAIRLALASALSEPAVAQAQRQPIRPQITRA